MAVTQALLLLLSLWSVSGQRPQFAGSKPIGYPDVATPANALGNKFGEESNLFLPLEANGDRALVERISKMPVDQQPFWYINWKALEENRKNPVSYNQRPSVFTDPALPSASSSAQKSDLSSRFNNDIQNFNRAQALRENYRNSHSRY